MSVRTAFAESLRRLNWGAAVIVLMACGGWCQKVQVPGGTVPGVVDVEAMAPGIVRVFIQPAGKTGERTLVLDPALKALPASGFRRDGLSLLSPEMSVTLVPGEAPAVELRDASGVLLLTLVDPLGEVALHHNVAIAHNESDVLYGMRGFDRFPSAEGFVRTGGADVAAGIQGDAGGPFFFTTRYGVLVDSDGGSFEAKDEILRYKHESRDDAEIFLIAGPPLSIMRSLAWLTGRAPMPPKWTLGLLNSQWGATEEELRTITARYETEHIPVSAYILDFDWKAWGEDHYGEWRWNSTSAPGNVFPDKFPNGANGSFAADLAKRGVHLAGILKPRILVNRVDGKPTEASAYATAHDFWYPDEKRTNDYFTHRLAGNLDFRKAPVRSWYWEHLRPAFQAGMTGWWNDEADYNDTTLFSNFQHLNMGRMLYEGQRADSSERVWSINRNYYLGAVRYGYAEWSGDVTTGFQSMAVQRRRMIATLNLGEPHWSMDVGGFAGHPTPQNYARWMQFGAFVPILRVHGDHDEKRQPWVYGPIASAAAAHAIRLRYDLLPYVYSAERETSETGVGIVRPLLWEFPDDSAVSDDVRAWMFGDALLVSPIVAHDERVHSFYLPRGDWFEYSTGHPVQGGREMQVATDAVNWSDIPLYVRSGSILATQPNDGSNNLSPKTPLILDVFPSLARAGTFTAYDDDGHTFNYETGAYFRQVFRAEVKAGVTQLAMSGPEGTYSPTWNAYTIRLHTGARMLFISSGKLTRFSDEPAWTASAEPGWTISKDRFGDVVLLRLPVRYKHTDKLTITVQ